MDEFKRFAFRFVFTLLIAPLMGWILLGFVEKCEPYWKSNKRSKRWIVLCGVFVLAAGVGGWWR